MEEKSLSRKAAENRRPASLEAASLAAQQKSKLKGTDAEFSSTTSSQRHEGSNERILKGEKKEKKRKRAK
jgi:hypothetical protein